jgi:hypothetical protein
MVSFPQANTHGSILTGTTVRRFLGSFRQFKVNETLLFA